VTRHVVQFSGGIGSFATALRVADAFGTDDLVMLIANTQVEDPDLWRFAAQTADHIGVPLTVVADGRTPFEVFADQRFLGNSRVAPCAIHLKQRADGVRRPLTHLWYLPLCRPVDNPVIETLRGGVIDGFSHATVNPADLSVGITPKLSTTRRHRRLVSSPRVAIPHGPVGSRPPARAFG
jgi:hypothetical protein